MSKASGVAGECSQALKEAHSVMDPFCRMLYQWDRKCIDCPSVQGTLARPSQAMSAICSTSTGSTSASFTATTPMFSAASAWKWDLANDTGSPMWKAICNFYCAAIANLGVEVNAVSEPVMDLRVTLQHCIQNRCLCFSSHASCTA